MADAKTATKTAKPSPRNGNVLPLGAHPGNTGGKKGRSGRKPEAFTKFLAKLRENPRLHEALEQAVSDPDSRGFASALKVLTDYDPEKPGQRVEHSGAIGSYIARVPAKFGGVEWQGRYATNGNGSSDS